jgi:hypothetical protein
MTPEISEFSYGFALTNEIVGWTALKAAPIFPSLIEEGRKGGGYDVRLDMPGVPLYLQFKRAECMSRRNSREIGKHKLPLSLPFYRFAVTQAKKSQQHELLRALDDGTNEVYYAAPRFHEIDEINKAWRAQAVAHRSIFVRPQTIGALGAEAHHVAYDSHRTYVLSEPRAIEPLSAADLANRLGVRLAEAKRPLRETLIEMNTSLDQAWERGKEQLLFGALIDEQSPYDSHTVAFRRPEVSTNSIVTRTPMPLFAENLQLRNLADKALQLFDAQLVVVQKGE